MRQAREHYHKQAAMYAPSAEQQLLPSMASSGPHHPSFSQPFIDTATYYRQVSTPVRYASPAPQQSTRNVYSTSKSQPRTYVGDYYQHFSNKFETARGAHSPGPYYAQEYHMPSTPPPPGARQRISDYTGSGDYSQQRGYHELQGYNYTRGQWPASQRYMSHGRNINMSGPLAPHPNQFMSFSGKFSITPDPGNFIDEEWQDVAARHSDRRGRQGNSNMQKKSRNMPTHMQHAQQHGQYSNQHGYQHQQHYHSSPPPPTRTKASLSPYHASMPQTMSQLPSPRNSMLPDDFQQAYEETCREMDEMQHAFREALSVYGDEAGDLTTFEVDELKSGQGMYHVTSTAQPEVGSTIPYRNESMPQLANSKQLARYRTSSLVELPNAVVQPQLSTEQQDTLVATAANYGQTSAPNLTPEMEQEYAAEQSANNAKVLEWLATQVY